MTDAINYLEGYLKGRGFKTRAKDKLEQDEAIYQEGKADGIKEVMDWVLAHSQADWVVDKLSLDSEWQDQVKEWETE